MLRAASLLTVVLALALPATASARVDAAGRGAGEASIRPSAPAAARAVVPGARTFVITGRGWGHGVGMSQYGALGFALRGTGYARILAHYYRGTTLAPAPVAKVRVLVGDGERSVAISSALPFRVRDADGKLHQLEAGKYSFGPGLRLKVDPAEPNPKPLRGPLFFTPGGLPLDFGGKSYRGALEVIVEKGKLRVINHVGLEQYLYGVVPDEVPPNWPVEALKAQAVVARSYALAVRKTGQFDLFDDTRSQVYGGIRAEETSTNAAVDATGGQVLTYAGKVATAFFFSTSGGRTAAIADVWSSPPVPYLVSVPDPYDSISPHHAWGPFRYTHANLQKALRVRGRLLDLRTTVNGSGRVDDVVAAGTNGESTTDATTVRRKLGLRSTWFRVGVFGLDRPAAAVQYGAQATLTGVARGLGTVVLEQRASTAIWERAAIVKPAADGSFSVLVRPTATTEYRLVAGRAPSPSIRVAVAARVTLASPAAGSLTGVARPLVAGATVLVQRLAGGTWRDVATAQVDTRGRFTATLRLVPGTYRARYAPGGLVAGVSKVLEVVAA